MSTLPGLAAISRATMLADPCTRRSPKVRMAKGKRSSHLQAGPSMQAVLLLRRRRRRGALILR